MVSHGVESLHDCAHNLKLKATVQPVDLILLTAIFNRLEDFAVQQCAPIKMWHYRGDQSNRRLPVYHEITRNITCTSANPENSENVRGESTTEYGIRVVTSLSGSDK